MNGIGIANYYQQATSLAPSLLGIAVAFGVGMYLAGTFLQNDKLKEAARREMYELVLIVMFLSFFLVPLGDIASAMVKLVDPKGSGYYCPTQDSQQVCHLLVGRGYLNAMAAESFATVESVISFYGLSKMTESVSINVQKAQAGRDVGLGKSMVPMNLIIEVFLSYLKTIIIVSTTQFYLLDFFVHAFPTLLLTGAMLRILPFSRKVGGTLIAVALAMYFFYPTMLSVFDSIYFSIEPSIETHMRLNRIDIFWGGGGQPIEITGNQISNLPGNPSVSLIDNNPVIHDMATSADIDSAPGSLVDSNLGSGYRNTATNISNTNKITSAFTTEILRDYESNPEAALAKEKDLIGGFWDMIHSIMRSLGRFSIFLVPLLPALTAPVIDTTVA
jgi:hypothetical protein